MEQTKLNYKVVGQGSPTIVFESGLGGHYAEAVAFEDTWRKLQVEHSQLSKKENLLLLKAVTILYSLKSQK